MLFGTAQSGIVLLLAVGAFIAEGWALVDALRHQPGAYTAAGKQTKTLWTALLTVATVIGFLGLPHPLGVPFTSPLSLIGLASIVVAIIYLATVRPAVHGHDQPGPHREQRGGW